ncbi:family 78 glycoside hydrolase catalytic domain [Caulobacter sp. LARHSG274]
MNRRRFLAASSLGTGVAVAAGPASAGPASAKLAVVDLRAENTAQLLGTAVQRPRLSWRMTGAERGLAQTAYRIRAAARRDDLAAGRADLWDSGLVRSAASLDIPFGGPELRSQQRVWWTVEAHDNHGRVVVSAPAWFEAGLTGPDDWRAPWLIAEDPFTAADRAAGVDWVWAGEALNDTPHALRLDFEAPPTLVRAEVLVTAKDTLRAVWANGQPVPWHNTSWGVLRPVPMQVRPGRNSLCLLVSQSTSDFFPPTGGAMASLIRLHLADGSIQRIASGPNWKGAVQPPPDWTEPGFDPQGWTAARPVNDRAKCDPLPAEPGILMRTGFTPAKRVVGARLYATALGAYEASINGRSVAEARLAPEISVADDHVFYQVYDVGDLITDGPNSLCALVGDGFYASAFTWHNQRYSFGPPPRRLSLQLRLDHADGSQDWIVTGPDWRVAPAPILQSEIYNGEVYDARLEVPGWDLPGFDASGWATAKVGAAPRGRLVPQTSPRLKAQQVLMAEKITEPRPGVYVVDFGQNFAGHVRLKVRGEAGRTVTLRFAEYLKPSGEVDQANLREALARDVYTLRGDPAGEVYAPHFTYHGFRYVQVEGYPGKPSAAEVEGVVVFSDCAPTGEMSFDNALLQKVWSNALWSQRSNFFGVPTDCPQRDERLGWMGDIQVFLDAAAFNMDVDAFIRRYLAEVRAGQSPGGAYPIVTPAPRSFGETLTAGWSEAGLILPWTLWNRYGDTAVIDENWPAMTRWMDSLAAQNRDFIWRNGRGCDLGDWLSVDGTSAGDETTPRVLCATAYWGHSARIMAEMAAATGRTGEAARYRGLFDNIKQAFAANLMRPDGAAGNGSQTSQVLALHFGLVSEEHRARSAQALADDIRRRGMKLSTGFLGTPYLLDVLADAGHHDVVAGLLLQTGYPSWGYMPIKGATTMWERWNGDTGDLGMNSFNHYAYGAVCGFYYRRLAGIAPAAPGFRRIKVDPLFLPQVGGVKASYRSSLGLIATEVSGDAGGLTRLKLTVPPNATAEVSLPAERSWREGGRPLQGRADVRRLGSTDGRLTLEVGAGDYVFSGPSAR